MRAFGWEKESNEKGGQEGDSNEWGLPEDGPPSLKGVSSRGMGGQLFLLFNKTGRSSQNSRLPQDVDWIYGRCLIVKIDPINKNHPSDQKPQAETDFTPNPAGLKLLSTASREEDHRRR